VRFYAAASVVDMAAFSKLCQGVVAIDGTVGRPFGTPKSDEIMAVPKLPWMPSLKVTAITSAFVHGT